MNRMPRICLGIAMSFALLTATVPAAHARTLTKPLSSNSNIGNWLDATLAWVGSLVTGTQHGQQAPSHKVTTGSGLDSGTTGTARPMTGSCIDPGGNPVNSPKCTGF
jgi:hypothetical protein